MKDLAHITPEATPGATPEAAPGGPTLGIDFGERRIGVAVSGPQGRMALPLTTIERKNDRQARRALARLAGEQRAVALVMGEPRRLDGSAGDAAERVRAFAERLASDTELPVTLVNEALTSVEAEERLRAAGVDLRRNRERVDAVAAQILLQEYLDRRAREGETG